MQSERRNRPTARRRLKKLALIVLALYIAGSSAFTVVFFRVFFARWDRSADNLSLRYEDIDSEAFPRTEFTFESGGRTLQGYLYPAENSRGVVVIAHGIHSGADDHLPETMYFVGQGWTVLAFDGTGYCGSEGAVSRGLSQMTIDLSAALDWLDTQPELCDAPTMLFGHSMGGYAVAAVLVYHPDVDAVVSIGGFNTPLGIMTALADRYVGPVCYTGWPFLAVENQILFGDYANISAVTAINMSDVPVMIVRGSEDETIPLASSIYGHADEITRDGVTLLQVTDSARGTHTTTWLSSDAAALYLDTEAQLEALQDEYGDPLPQDVHDEFFSTIDKTALFAVDEDFMAQVNDFYLAALA